MKSIVSYCNLASINVDAYYKLNEEDRYKLVFNTLEVLDQCVERGVYVGKNVDADEGFRNVGLGVLNLVYLVEQQGFHIDSQEASEFIDELFDNISYNATKASVELAKIKGPCKRQEKWKDTLPCLQHYKNFKKCWELTNYGKNYDFTKWEQLLEEIKKYGVRFSALMAVAPTSHSGKVINATLGVEPPQRLQLIEDNVNTSISYVPGYGVVDYKLAFDCDQQMLLQQTAIMQKWVDQSISHTIFMNSNSIKVLSDLHFWAFEHGIKTLYYMKQQKIQFDECSSCVV